MSGVAQMADTDIDDAARAERHDVQLALGRAFAAALLVLVGLTVYLWTL
jgi:hypothetical protein